MAVKPSLTHKLDGQGLRRLGGSQMHMGLQKVRAWVPFRESARLTLLRDYLP